MTLPHWQDLVLDAEALPEPTDDASRIVLWLRGDRDRGFQYWERVGNVARAEITVEEGLCTTPATSIPARERVGGFVTKLVSRLREPKGDRDFLAPHGRSARQCGERQTDLLLVWPLDQTGTLEEARLKARWPDGKVFRKLAKNLYLVSGVRAVAQKNEGSPVQEQPPTGASQREFAEQVLAATRAGSDRSKEATALIDLGAVALSEGDTKRSREVLEEALSLTRQLGDQARESDVLGNLAMTYLALGQPPRARELLEQELSLARARNDKYAEKFALERLGVATWNMGNAPRALALFDQALALTRKLGDRHQEATLLWHQGIQHAEMGQRELAIARAEEAITLMKLLGKPQAAWYGSYLQKYRMGLDEQPGADKAAAAGGFAPQSYLGGSVIASVMGQQPMQGTAAAKPKAGPGLLRMAMSATKAMANFVGTGFKTASPEVSQKRLQVCALCEHHTGMRCKICGCFTQVKSRMLSEDCPIGKWPPVPTGS